MKVYEVKRANAGAVSIFLTSDGIANLCLTLAGGGYAEGQTIQALAARGALTKDQDTADFCPPVRIGKDRLRSRLVADMPLPPGTKLVTQKDLDLFLATQEGAQP